MSLEQIYSHPFRHHHKPARKTWTNFENQILIAWFTIQLPVIWNGRQSVNYLLCFCDQLTGLGVPIRLLIINNIFCSAFRNGFHICTIWWWIIHISEFQSWRLEARGESIFLTKNVIWRRWNPWSICIAPLAKRRVTISPKETEYNENNGYYSKEKTWSFEI